MAAEDVDGAARLVGQLAVPAYRQGRVTTIQRWFGWLEDRGGIGGHPMVAVLASLFYALTGRPVDAERWADAVDRWQYGDPARLGDPTAEAWAALLRAILCRRGTEQMRADADEAVRRFAAGSFVTPAPALLQGIARILCGDLDGGDLSLEDAVSIGEEADAPDDLALALCERSLVAMARNQWDRAEVLAERARAVLRRVGIEESYATPLICALQARAAMHRGDVPAARRELVSAQHLRPLLTYALPHFAVQARMELARVHLALADLPGARTLMREVDDLLKRLARPRDPRRGGRSAPGPAVQGTRCRRPRRVGADRRRAAPAAAAVHPPVVPRDRRGDVPVPLHGQVAGDVDLPQAGGLLTQPGRDPLPGARAAGGMTRRSFIPPGRWNSPRQEMDWGPTASRDTQASGRA